MKTFNLRLSGESVTEGWTLLRDAQFVASQHPGGGNIEIACSCAGIGDCDPDRLQFKSRCTGCFINCPFMGH
jgi:hypothetical protein